MTPYTRLCAGTPASVWEYELPANDPRDAAEGKTRLGRNEQPAVPGCGHPVMVTYIGQTAPDKENPDARRLFAKGAAVVQCKYCDAPTAQPEPTGAE